MSRVRDVNERPNYPIDSDETFDDEGYCLAPGDDGGDHLHKTASVTDSFMGVNHKSSYDIEDETIYSGGGPQPASSSDGMGGMSVEQDGVVNMQCKEGNTYSVGETVYLSATAGVANNTDSGSDTVVGTVYKKVDLSSASSPDLVPVDITGKLGK